jgi:transposase
MRNRVAIRLELEDRARLESLVAGRNTPQKQVYRARIVLLTADGVGTMEIMRRTGQSKPTVWRWQERFVTAGVDGLLCDATRPPGKKPLAATLVKQVVEMTLHQKPPGATHWTSRSMARSAGIGVSSVQRIWRAHGLKPHLVKTFKLSNDPRFVEKLRDVVGLYISPPERALVLSVDEKTQIQALDRTQPGLPMKKGRAGTMTHDYKRHGTTTSLLRSMWRQARSSGSVRSATVTRSFCASCASLIDRHLTALPDGTGCPPATFCLSISLLYYQTRAAEAGLHLGTHPALRFVCRSMTRKKRRNSW